MKKRNSALFQWTFYPATLIICLLVFFYLLSIMPKENILLIPLVVNLVVVGLVLFGEWFMPYHEGWTQNQGDQGTDFFQTFVSLPLASKLAEFALPLLLYYPIIWIQSRLHGDIFFDEIPIVGQCILLLLASEFCYYWIHRISHNHPFLWRFHAVHHGAERVYWLNSGRFHFLDAFLDNLFYLFPMALLPSSPEVVVGILTLNLITGYLEHANVDFKTAWLVYVFNTAELHRWHHSEKREESNNNFGKVLSIWDLVFGTFYLPPKRKITQVGLGGKGKVSNCLWKQLIFPFKQNETK